ncbi:hypothetical protein F1D05_24860 [Kribbella qitaiheensis]|uniref:Uncharacterized protein n=1 Tax=Kribbella qitaiheensis TaxID=1544730 RepID=A0A7G6X2T5_9ACTN|nr:hypothetical protein [Kribbella qitaiheensis]QNE20550.1 hypothetical protein F1D05_24860 [Kribbella qitaiheensis]
MLHGSPAHTVTIGAAAPETVDIPVSAFPTSERLRIDVRAITSPWNTLVGSSAVFDTDLRFDGYIQELRPNTDGTLGLTWIYTGTPDDATDPLDLPISHLGGPLVSTPTGCDWQQVGNLTGSTVATTMANRPRPHQLRFRSNEEWGNSDSVETWEIDSQAVTPLSLPSVANFNQTLTLKGKLELVRPGACAAGKPRPTLQTQPSTGGTLKMSWNIVTSSDDTPADPLDLPLPYNSRPLVSAPVGCDWQELPAVPGQKVTTTLPAHSLPYRVSTRTTEEWAGTTGPTRSASSRPG